MLTTGQIPKVANVPNGGVAAVVPASVVTLGVDANGVACYTAGSQGGRVYGLVASLNDTVVANLMLYILNGATVKPLGLINVPLSSGNVSGASSVNLLDPSNATSALRGLPIDEQGNRYIPLLANEVLKCGTIVALSANKTLYVTAIGSDYQA
jgi:hypothetical protein